MSKSKLLSYTVIGLFLINIITLSFLLFKSTNDKPFSKKRIEPKEIIVEKLHFDKEQVLKYEVLIKNHMDSVELLNKQIVDKKNILYTELSKPNNKFLTDSLTNNIAIIQTSIEKLHYNHFLEIKKLCKPEQLNDFTNLTVELAKIFSPKPPPKREKP